MARLRGSAKGGSAACRAAVRAASVRLHEGDGAGGMRLRRIGVTKRGLLQGRSGDAGIGIRRLVSIWAAWSENAPLRAGVLEQLAVQDGKGFGADERDARAQIGCERLGKESRGAQGKNPEISLGRRERFVL